MRLYYTSRLASLADTSARRKNETKLKNGQIKPREKAVHAEPLVDRLFFHAAAILYFNIRFYIRLVFLFKRQSLFIIRAEIFFQSSKNFTPLRCIIAILCWKVCEIFKKYPEFFPLKWLYSEGYFCFCWKTLKYDKISYSFFTFLWLY